MATSSAASERNFSALGFIQSKLRNSLSPKTVEKLVFIKSNLPAFYENETGDDNDYQSDFQSDDSVPSAA
jgi:hAT family C-terminal dimerisation region